MMGGIFAEVSAAELVELALERKVRVTFVSTEDRRHLFYVCGERCLIGRGWERIMPLGEAQRLQGLHPDFVYRDIAG